jgi:SpoVK/Ycf46/Vps4 family AAA+-type ATPase
MVNTDQIVTLIRSHVNNDDEMFRRVALQISASEAKLGHTKAAAAIHEAISAKPTKPVLKLAPANNDLDDLFMVCDKRYRLKDLIVSIDVRKKVERVIKEYIEQDKLHKYNLENRRKILLYGASGTGKTMTAEILAFELNLPFIVVRTDKVVTKFMGETGLKLGRVFDLISSMPAIYLFDEFDAIGTQRGLDNEVGEQRRILNTFLQLLEHDHSSSIIVAATNNFSALDKALFRRFDDTIEYCLPENEEVVEILKRELCRVKDIQIDSLAKFCIGMSHAEIKMACADARKESLLYNKKIDESMLSTIIKSRKLA